MSSRPAYLLKQIQLLGQALRRIQCLIEPADDGLPGRGDLDARFLAVSMAWRRDALSRSTSLPISVKRRLTAIIKVLHREE